MKIPPIPAEILKETASTPTTVEETTINEPDVDATVPTVEAKPAEPPQAVQPPEPAAGPAADVERLIAEAEERGYKRGRNERIAELMEHPSQADPELRDTPPTDRPQILILNNLRPSVWEL